MEIDYLILADHAEVNGNKLYLMGGGWDTMSVAEVPANIRVSVAAGIRIEWDESASPVPLVIRVDDDDAQEVFQLNGQMNVMRPAEATSAAASQLSQIVFALQMQLQKAGGYRVTLTVGGGDQALRRSIPFRLAVPPTVTR